MKKKRISLDEYSKLMDSIIAEKLSVPDTLIKMLEVASRCEIIGMKEVK